MTPRTLTPADAAPENAMAENQTALSREDREVGRVLARLASAQVLGCDGTVASIAADARLVIVGLSARIEKLQQDARRLDWLFSDLHDHRIAEKMAQVADCYALRVDRAHDFRTAIDAAMRSTPDKASVTP